MVNTNAMTIAKAQVLEVHKNQMLKRVEAIRDVAKNNNNGCVDIMSAGLSHITDLANKLMQDYKEPDQ